MIVKILPKPSKNFAGVNYNTNKIDRNRGELMKAVNFGPLNALSNLRPQDYINYFQMVSAQNKRVGIPQFHAVLSAKGQSYTKTELTALATAWLQQMGYGNQPYLVVFHKDTDNNHVHVVTTRVSKNGRKISSAYEHVRSQACLQSVLGYTYADQYAVSTRAQFYLLIERAGFIGRDFDERKLEAKLQRYELDMARAAEIKQLLLDHKGSPGFEDLLKSSYGIELVYHSSEGKKLYGYTIIDHHCRQVFKGSEVLKLSYLLDGTAYPGVFTERQSDPSADPGQNPASGYDGTSGGYIGPIYIADDIDDQQVLGMKRKRQRKARTNTR